MYLAENQIWSDMHDFLLAALAYWGVAGWTVTRDFQPTKGNFNAPYLLIHRLFNTTNGTLQQYDRVEDGALMHETAQLEEITFQVDAVKFRRPGYPQDATSADVLNKIRLWFNGPGVDVLKNKQYSAFLVKQVNEPFFETENDTFEKNPNLQIELVVRQSDKRPEPSVESWNPTIKGV